MADRKKKEGKTKIQKFEYFVNKKNFLDEIKNIFQFLKGYHLVKSKNLIKIVDTSFNLDLHMFKCFNLEHKLY